MDIRILSLCFILGVYGADKINFSNTIFVFVAIFCVCAVHSVLRRRCDFTVLLMCAVFMTGNVLYKVNTSDEFCDSTKYISQDVTLTGRICDFPETAGGVMKYNVDAYTINNNNIDENILVYSPVIFEYGDTVTFYGKLRKCPQKENRFDYDIERYYKRHKITTRLTADKAFIATADRTNFTLFTDLKYSIARLIDNYYNGDIAAVFKAVLTGNKNGFSEKTENVLNKTGIKSLFYPAYLHMLIFNVLLVYLSGIMKKKPREFLTIIISVFYILLNMAHGSFIRTFMFAAAIPFSRVMFKKVNYSDIVFTTVLITGIINPLILTDTGYVLSNVNAVIIHNFWRIDNKKQSGWVYNTIKVQLLSTILILPLTAYYFGAVSPYIILAAPLMLAAVCAILILSPVLLIMLALFKTAPLIGSITEAFAIFMAELPYMVEKLPLSRIHLTSPSPMVIAAHFLLVTGLAYIIRKKKDRAKIFIAVSLAVYAFSGIWGFTRFNTVEITHINVGSGDGALIRTVKENILIDGGGSGYSDYNIGERVFLPYIMRKGAMRIDAAFVSHYHADHVQGIVAAVENINVKNIFMPDLLPENEWRIKLENAARKNNTKISYINANTRIIFDDGLVVDITLPDALTLKSSDENDTSMLINVSYGDFNCLFTGDMTTFAEKNFLEKGKVPKADVLKVSHHGSKTSTSEEFFGAVSPEFSVISKGEDNGISKLSDMIQKRLLSSQIIRTDLNGDIQIIADKRGKVRIKTLR